MRNILILAAIGLLAFHYKKKLGFSALSNEQTEPSFESPPIVNPNGTIKDPTIKTQIVTQHELSGNTIIFPNDPAFNQGYNDAPTIDYTNEGVGDFVGEIFVLEDPNKFYLDLVLKNNNVIFSGTDGFSVAIRNGKVKLASGKDFNTFPSSLLEVPVWTYFLENLPQYVIT